MDFSKQVALMEHHARAIQVLTRGLTDEQARWKPNADAWSILEVINHLCDEEREDFRLRLELFLFHPNDPWPAIHPGAWVTERAYNSRELEPSVNNYLAERENSLLWLGKLGDVDWTSSVRRPSGDELKAGDLFNSWVAHDVLHLRQLVELHFELVKQNAAPFDVGYAGDW